MDQTALLIGNSDGIGLEFSRELLKRGWTVTGISRSESAINHSGYRHIVKDVRKADYRQQLILELNGRTAPCFVSILPELVNYWILKKWMWNRKFLK